MEFYRLVMNCEERRKGVEIGETHGGGLSKIGKRYRINCGVRIHQRKVKIIIERPEMKRRK